MGDERNGGFVEVFTPEDEYMRDLYERNGLDPNNLSLDKIQPVAIKKLADPLQRLTGIELVLNRHVKSEEVMKDAALRKLYTSQEEPEDQFATLLILKSTFQQNL